MRKIIKLKLENTNRIRTTEDTYCEIYSHDKNNGLFEFEIVNEYLTVENPKAVFKFVGSNKVWQTDGTVVDGRIKVKFDTTLITHDEIVVCWLYLDEEQRSSDAYRFKFKVKLSEIDKVDGYETKERFIKDTVIVDRLDVLTKADLEEAIKDIKTGTISSEGLLTETKAEETYAKKSEAVDNTNFELVKNRVLALELKTDKDTVYDDSELKGRVSVLEAKHDNDTVYDDTNVRERLTALESKPNIDVNNLVTKDELASKNYLTEHQDTSKFALKSEIPQEYNDTEVKERLTNLENKAPVDLSNLATKEELNEVRNSQPTVDTSNLVTRDELESKGYVTDLSEYAKKSELYNDSDLRNRVVALETKEDKDTKYDDTEVKHRLTELENKPAVDTSFFVTEEKLNSKGYISDISGLATKQELANAVTKDELEAKHYVTEEELNNKAYLTQQNLDNYALKSEIPTPYNDSEVKQRLGVLEAKQDKDTIYDDTPLKERVTALESKAIEGGAYDDSDLRNRVVALESIPDVRPYNDTELRNRVTNLENKPPLDTSEFVTNQALESKGYIKDVSNLVTKDELEGKHYISDISNLVTKEELENKGYLKTHQNLDNVVTKEELATKGYITDVSNLVTKEELESKNYLTTPYNDTPLKERVEVLENKVDKDTIYNDTELRNRVEVLENKPNVDLSDYVTNEQLENKGFIKQHQELSHLATTSDLEALRNIAVSKAELSKKLDTTEYNSFKDSVVTKTELAEKGYLTTHQDISNLATKQEVEDTYAKKSDLPTPYNDSTLVQKIGQLEAKVDKDTVYDDSEVKRRLTELETRPTGTSYNDKPLSDRVKVLEDTPKVDATEYNSFKESTTTNVISVRDRLGRLEKSILSNNNSLSNQTLSLNNNTLSISGGNSVELPTSQSEMRGVGMPNGVVEAPIGTTYVDTAKTNGALKWIKTTDGGNTGWKVAEGDTGWVLGWQADKGDNKNRMYFRRKNDVVHVKFNPEINTRDINQNTNLILDMGGNDITYNLSIQGFQPIDDILQTIFKKTIDVYNELYNSENSEASQGKGVVVLHYLYNDNSKIGLELLIATSQLGVDSNHVNPFSYLTEDEWPTQLPIIGG